MKKIGYFECLTPKDAIEKLIESFSREELNFYPKISLLFKELKTLSSLKEVQEVREKYWKELWNEGRKFYRESTIDRVMLVLSLIGLVQNLSTEEASTENMYVSHWLGVLKANDRKALYSPSETSNAVSITINCQLRHSVENQVGDVVKILTQKFSTTLHDPNAKKELESVCKQIAQLIDSKYNLYHIHK